MKKKLFVWTDHCPDYSSGLAFAIAKTEKEARKLVVKSRNGTEPYIWGDLAVYPVTKSIAFAVTGGS